MIAAILPTFKSFKTATIIMVNLPLALIGGVFAIALTGGILSIASVIGFITLFGLSTRNSILLVNRFVDIQKENPILLQVGDEVRFTVVSD